MKKCLKILPTPREQKKPAMSQKKFLVEWYATAFDPQRQKQNQDFAKAIKQTAPAFDTERLDSQRYSAMNGISALVTSALNGPNLERSMTPDEAKALLIEDWRPILGGKAVDFRIIGTKVGSVEADIWVFHIKSQTLFMLHFATPRKDDNWLEPMIYRFK